MLEQNESELWKQRKMRPQKTENSREVKMEWKARGVWLATKDWRIFTPFLSTGEWNKAFRWFLFLYELFVFRMTGCLHYNVQSIYFFACHHFFSFSPVYRAVLVGPAVIIPLALCVSAGQAIISNRPVLTGSQRLTQKQSVYLKKIDTIPSSYLPRSIYFVSSGEWTICRCRRSFSSGICSPLIRAYRRCSISTFWYSVLDNFWSIRLWYFGFLSCYWFGDKGIDVRNAEQTALEVARMEGNNVYLKLAIFQDRNVW